MYLECCHRYGKIYRGNRLRNCQRAGAIGLIMFSDPNDVAVLGVNASEVMTIFRNTKTAQVYPEKFFLPESGIQRGSTFIGSPRLSYKYRAS